VPNTSTSQPAANSAHPSYAAPKCINCVHFSEAKKDQRHNLCQHPGHGLDLVTGVPIKLLCESVRYSVFKCDESGQWFEPSIKPAAIKARCIAGGIKSPLAALRSIWSDHPCSDPEAAWAALTNGLESLSAAQIQQRFAAEGIEITLDAAADLQIEAVSQRPDGVVPVIGLDDEHAIKAVDMGDSAGLHGASLDDETAIMGKPIVAPRKASVIHIYGKQGVGRSILASDIVDGFKKRGKNAVALTEEGLQFCFSKPEELHQLRQQPIMRPSAGVEETFDVLIAEYSSPINPELVVRDGDLVITMVAYP